MYVSEISKNFVIVKSITNHSTKYLAKVKSGDACCQLFGINPCGTHKQERSAFERTRLVWAYGEKNCGERVTRHENVLELKRELKHAGI